MWNSLNFTWFQSPSPTHKQVMRLRKKMSNSFCDFDQSSYDCNNNYIEGRNNK